MSTGDEPSPEPTLALRPSTPPPREPPAPLPAGTADPVGFGTGDDTDPAGTATGSGDAAVEDGSSGGSGADRAPDGPGEDTGAGRTRRRRPPTVAVAGFLLVAAAVLEILALIPAEAPGDYALGHAGATLTPPIVLAGGFVVSAILLGVPRRRAAPAGAALAAGLVLAAVGLLVAQLGEILASDSLGAGDGLLIAALAVAGLGTVLAVGGQRGGVLGRAGRPRRRDNAVLTLCTLVAGVVLGVALLPAWDRYHLVSVQGSATELQGSVFGSHVPAAVLIGSLLAAVVFAAVPVVAVLWRPGRIGAVAAAGVIVVVVGETLSAVLQISETTIAQFGYGSTAARDIDLSIRSSLTGWYDAEVIAAVALLLLVVARWWTPAGGALLDSYPFGGVRDQEVRHPAPAPVGGTAGWGPPLSGSTARPGPGHIGHGTPQPSPGAWSETGPGAPHGTTAGHR